MRLIFLLSDDSFSSENFAGALRETLLQDLGELVEEEPLILEITVQLCFVLAYGSASPWRADGYAALYNLY